MFKVICLSIGSLILLFIVTKITGNRAISQMTMFDYIVGITIGSIAAEMATSLESDFMEPLVAIIVYGLVTLITAILACKFLPIRRIVNGRTLIIIDNGNIYVNNFKKAKLDMNDVLMEARLNGYYNINDIQTAILETNGKISFLPKSNKRLVNVEDLNLNVSQDGIVINLILDGKIMEDNLKSINEDKIWLINQLKKQNINNIENVFLCICDNNKNISVYLKNNEKREEDSFK